MGCSLNTDLGQRIQYVPSKQLLWLWAFVQAAVGHAVLNNLDWKVEKFKTDCGTIHPEAVGPKSISLALRVSSNTRAKKRPSELQVQSSSSEVLAEDSERWVIQTAWHMGVICWERTDRCQSVTQGNKKKHLDPTIEIAIMNLDVIIDHTQRGTWLFVLD